jgi:UPF0716 family protein affecting phage T7 exclusion
MKRLTPEERQVLVTCFFVAAVLVFLPGQWVEGIISLVLFGFARRWHRKLLAKEAAQEAALASATSTEQPQV